jgi:hypothetical protein
LSGIAALEFGLDGPGANFQDRSDRGERMVRGLTVKEHLAHLREGLMVRPGHA